MDKDSVLGGDVLGGERLEASVEYWALLEQALELATLQAELDCAEWEAETTVEGAGR